MMGKMRGVYLREAFIANLGLVVPAIFSVVTTELHIAEVLERESYKQQRYEV